MAEQLTPKQLRQAEEQKPPPSEALGATLERDPFYDDEIAAAMAAPGVHRTPQGESE